jgi:TPR repeat protein
MHQLGCCYEQGIGVNRDAEAAVKLYREGANLGYPDAMISLAICLETGLILPVCILLEAARHWQMQEQIVWTQRASRCAH